jgi:outer membrane receptor protein involved in Fe transport
LQTSSLRPSRRGAAWLGGVALSAILAGSAAAADQASGDSGELVVTGSRIIHSDVLSTSPLTVVTSAQISNAGEVSLSEILRRDPAIGSQGIGQSNNLSGGGAQVIDLRNLGVTETLVLLNGRRYSLFLDSLNNQGQDLSFIPIAMLDRVEVLRDGASTAYGADAVAGVVNFILKDRFEGVDLSGFYGVSGRGDVQQYRASGVIGAGNDRGHVVVGLEVQHSEPLTQSSREDWLGVPIGLLGPTPATSLYGSGYTPGGRLYDPNTGGVVQCFNNTGGVATGACPRFDYAPYQSISAGQQIYNAAINANYQITDHIQLIGSVVYGDRQSKTYLAAQPIAALSGYVGPYPDGIIIGAASANNPYGQDLALQWRPNMYARRISQDSGDQLWLSVGAKGDLVDGRYHWEFNHTYARTQSANSTASVPNAVHLTHLLNTDQCAVDPLCSAVGPVSNIFDFFSQKETLTKGQVDYAFYTQTQNALFSTTDDEIEFNGPIMTLPAGDWSFSVGAEYRRETGQAQADAVTQSGESTANAVQPTNGSYSVKELFGETEIPLIKDVPFIQELTANLQGRYSDFSNFGSATTYKGGLNWRIDQNFRLRATYGTSFRAPGVQELYGQGIQSYDSIIDPCNAPIANTQVAANCAALGVSPAFVQTSPQLLDLAGGNPNLKPERGRSWTVGAVLTPQWGFLRGFQGTVDYYNIRVKSVIERPDLSSILERCYEQANFLSTLSKDPANECFNLQLRSSAGNLTTLVDRLENLSEESTSGVDFTLSYRFNSLGPAPGFLQLTARSSWLRNFIIDGFDFTGQTYQGGTDIASAFPKFRTVVDVDYHFDDHWSLMWTGSYISGMTDGYYGSSAVATNNYLNYKGPPSYLLNDLLLSYGQRHYNVHLGINNIFDKKPPYVYSTGSNTSPEVYDVIGRYFFLSANVRF